ncbi:MAG: hypothetical protein M3Y74_00310, partial [Chloroflexota bacterium]|nr:hypothetical protein [Chloroflexota bacterium]
RCERSGMRWTIDGAEALLHLRCVHENGDWDAYHAFRRRQRHQRLYAVPYPDDAATPLDFHVLDTVCRRLAPARRLRWHSTHMKHTRTIYQAV